MVFCYNENMKTGDLDVVYFVKAFPSSDLRYSIRSVAENLEFHMLYIYGGKRYNIAPDRYYKIMNQKGATKWDRVRNMYLEVCNNKYMSEDFILFHDDFFVMKHVKEIKPEYRGTISEHINDMRLRYGNKLSEYTKLLINAEKLLKEAGKTTYSYELHKPFIFNRKKLKNILELYPKAHCIRSIYANYYEIGGKKVNDVKIFGKKANFDWKCEPIISTSDVITGSDNEYWNYIKKLFSEKCRFEA